MIEWAIKINPEDINYYGLKAEILLTFGKESKALELLNISIEKT
ncbi:hypothetical protein LCGC14_1097170 [marine sediment metagenome]|uniref:Uncharacterized protein n=1 Tax=marine sediment metagenome TaxID=412755 RepID=A0A0F9MAN9_9ZZZZ